MICSEPDKHGSGITSTGINRTRKRHLSTQLSEFQNATVGATVGVIEVLVLQPFNYCKNMLQQGMPIEMNPAKMYRGVASNAVNMGGCTMIQFAVGGALKGALHTDKSKPMSKSQEMGAGLGAGMVSAMWGTPLELIMIQQQRKGGSTPQTLKNMVSGSHLTRGFLGCAIREGLWCVGYMSIPPIIRREFRSAKPDIFDTDDKARIPASLLGGAFACYLTQPVDTIKTCMQGDVERKTYKNFVDTGKVIYREVGFTGFYRGATFRYGRMVCAVFMMDKLASVIGPAMYPAAFA
ncbi:hypothetical protein TrLO_g1648 [Triparma laevis f. longispina]|uniref:Uncharacterized protein n=3 Tax=Triparma laevis TaxID=1534972 RepID=A0A9W7E992_9STRA|nr:hypothetical protein TrLO_g1648 [Triparma laevis f. longispina]